MSINPFEGIAKKAQEDQLKEMRLAMLKWCVDSGWINASVKITDYNTDKEISIEKEKEVI